MPGFKSLHTAPIHNRLELLWSITIYITMIMFETWLSIYYNIKTLFNIWQFMFQAFEVTIHIINIVFTKYMQTQHDFSFQNFVPPPFKKKLVRICKTTGLFDAPHTLTRIKKKILIRRHLKSLHCGRRYLKPNRLGYYCLWLQRRNQKSLEAHLKYFEQMLYCITILKGNVVVKDKNDGTSTEISWYFNA